MSHIDNDKGHISMNPEEDEKCIVNPINIEGLLSVNILIAFDFVLCLKLSVKKLHSFTACNMFLH